MKLCRICSEEIILTCDRTKPSKLEEWFGTMWLQKKPQFVYVYPTAKKQTNLCYYHEHFKEK